MMNPTETYLQLRSDLVNLKRTLALLRALPQFFRERVTVPQAEEEIKRLLDTRAERFLGLVRSEVYEGPASPYLRLLKHAGCEFSDLQSQVHRNGLENTLAKLAGEGVYLTSDEFKSKQEVVRGTTSFRVSPKDFERRHATAGFTITSSGTRNQPVKSFSSLDWRLLQALAEAIFYQAHDFGSYAHAVLDPVLAGTANFILINAKLGIPTARWFAPKLGSHGTLEDGYYRLNARLVAQFGRLIGPGISDPEYLDSGDFDPVIEWVREMKRQQKSCCIKTIVSNATSIARVALERGQPLANTIFQVGGEPLTQTKKRIVENAGARITVFYGAGGSSGTSFGCGNAEYIDEMHIPTMMFTFVENPRVLDFSGLPIHPLVQTSLHPAAPRFLLNVENGDYATMIRRDCGCPLEKVGFTQHLHTVRSFEKMTSEGMNYSGTDLFELLENAIPSEFGGGPGDYQLVEEEDERGQTRLTLVVRPEVGDLHETNLLSRLRQGLAQGSRNHRFMSQIWQDAGAFRIRREAPHASARGKTLPLYIKPKT